MPSAYTRPSRPVTAIAAIIALACISMPAAAGSRAPIVYANQTAPAAQPASKPVLQLAETDKASQRIEFRYPGSTTAPARVEMASSEPPKPLKPAAEQAYLNAPQFAPSAPAFDAASTAAQVAATSLGPVVSTAMPEPVIAIPAAPAGKAVGNREVAVVYGDEFDGLPTANGEIFNQAALTAAHPTLPLPSMVAITNPANGKEVVVRVNDRGPFEDGATLQVSRQAARALGFEGAGKAELTMRVVDEQVSPVASYQPKPSGEPKLVQVAARQPVTAQADELLGGDELAGGASWSAPAAPRAAVKWPDPPSNWDVAPATAKDTALAGGLQLAAAPAGNLYVQLASFSDIGNAETLYRGLQRDLPVEIVPARVNGADYFRVRVGPVASRASAEELRDRLAAEGKGDGRVVAAE